MTEFQRSRRAVRGGQVAGKREKRRRTREERRQLASWVKRAAWDGEPAPRVRLNGRNVS